MTQSFQPDAAYYVLAAGKSLRMRYRQTTARIYEEERDAYMPTDKNRFQRARGVIRGVGVR